MRRAALLVFASLTLGAQCEGNPLVSFEVLLPTAVADAAQWMEIGVLPGQCPTPGQLAGGIPVSGTVARVAFQKGNTGPPAVGDLPKASYAFAAVARASDCGVLATGCTQVDVTSARDVSIALTATASPTGACTAGETCTEGRCAPSLAPSDPSLGAGCSMQLLGAGPLGDPLALSGSDTASAPALAVTEDGFLLAYREYDPVAGAARVTVAAVDPGGGLTIGAPAMLPAQCSSQDESDAVGLGYLGGAGVVVSARPPCAGQSGPGLDTLAVDPQGNIQQTSFDATADALTLSNAHATTLTGASTGFVATVEDGAASLLGLSGLATTGSPSAFQPGPGQTLAEVAATDGMVALLAGDGTTLRLRLGAGPADGGGAPYATAGAWGAVAAEAERAYVLAGGTASTTLAFQAFDLGAAGASANGSFTPPGQGAPVGGDVAFEADRVVFAAEQPGAISLTVYDHASTSPVPLRSVLLSDDPRVPSQANVRDGRIAVVMTDSRVLVAWITASNLGPDDPVGGYALYACAP